MLSSLAIRIRTVTAASIVAAGIVSGVIACSTYGWADADVEQPAAVSIYVESISAPAHLGLDTTALRARLVGDLERHGVAAASAEPAESLRCSLGQERTTGIGAFAVARIVLSCDILHHRGATAPKRLRTTGLAADGVLSGGDVADDVFAAGRRAPTLAATDAISQMVPRIVDELRPRPDASTE